MYWCHVIIEMDLNVCISQGGSAVRAGGQCMDERGQRNELAQPSAYDPPHHQPHSLVREVSRCLIILLGLDTICMLQNVSPAHCTDLIRFGSNEMPHFTSGHLWRVFLLPDKRPFCVFSLGVLWRRRTWRNV